MDSAEVSQNTMLPANLAYMLNSSYDDLPAPNQLPSPLLVPFSKRPRPSQIRERLAPMFDSQNASSLIPAAARAVGAAWEAYTEGFVAPSDFLRAPIGALYRVAQIPGKGRGMLASRDLAAGEVVLAESPSIVLVKDQLNALTFFALPKPAIHAILLLHNAMPDNRQFSLAIDIPQHRLLDYLNGVATTNTFGAAVDAQGTQAGIIVLAGSLFNHSLEKEANVHRMFDISTFKMVFTTVSAVKKGEELMINYNQTRQQLKDNYGIV